MSATTILLMLLSLIIALGLAFYQYFYKNKHVTKTTWLLASLRFVAIFAILLLLLNPILSSKTYEVVKPPFPIIIDNSSSIANLNANGSALKIQEKLLENDALKEKYAVQAYRFDSEFQASEAVDFKGKQTNLEAVANGLKSIYRNVKFPSVIITDGNQTTGSDYVFSFKNETRVFPVVVGDTTTFLDLKIGQLNVNKYAFHKNKFPVEVFLNYAGTKRITANFKISDGNTIYNSQQLVFSPENRSAILNVLLPANKVGLQVYKAAITSNESEKNTYNNTKNFAVEVIDQKTNIAIVSEIVHPDLGAFKRAIETNAQRKVTISKPNEISKLSDYNVLILYQPSTNFRALFESNVVAGVNTFIVTGVSTDYTLLNEFQSSLQFKMSGQREDYVAGFQSKFNLFAIDDIGFDQFPPLQNAFGTVTANANVNVLLSSRIRNIETNSPLLLFAENQGKRSAYLLGENSWKWRMASHIENKSYEKYDLFIDKIIQYLSSNNSRKSLIVNHESFYNSGDAIEITAQYFNKNYELDEKARLTITLTNKKTKKLKKYDLLRSSNAFKVNLDGLEAGQYQFAVKEQNSNTIYNGYFEILDFDIEQQFVNPDLKKLQQLAVQTKGQVYMPDQVDTLIKSLLNNPEYRSIEKAIVKKTPLIDWIWLLIIIAFALGSEWFIRKYNGLL